tara:strand:- start:37 stop:1872 length:1836 start_codon:yes stop_codon:yes gene_type:complete
MSIIETLTEGIVNRNLQQEGAALLNKWTQTGLLEGLNESQKSTMAVLLENQAKSLLKEASSMSAGDVEGFAAVAFPIVRRVFAGLIANDLVSVQPMSLPSGLIFFLDFKFSPNAGGGAGVFPRMGNASDKSIYGTDQVGSAVTGGVDLVNSTSKAGFSGPGRDGSVGYAYSSPSGSLSAVLAGSSAENMALIFTLDGNVSDANKKRIQYDPDLLAITDSTQKVIVLDVDPANIVSNDGPADFNNLSAFQIGAAGVNTAITNVTADTAVQIRRLSARVKAADAFNTPADANSDSIRFVFTIPTANASVQAAANLDAGLTAAQMTFPIGDNIPAGGAVGSVQSTATNYALENESAIPEIDIKVDSIAITAQTKKLKAKWTPELGQDLNAYHNIDAEVELTSILSEQIALEIDREILADLVNGATAATYYWSRSPGLFVNRETGAELGAQSAAPDFTGTVSEWYETLIETINDVSAQIHRKTLRGGATHVVCSPEVANILEFTAGFRANVTADADRGDIGATKVGSLNRKFDVIVDPYFPRNVLLVARIGSSFLESGYVYAPYVPLQTTPTIFGTEDFVPRKGVMTRYAKKMVRPDMYGLVICRDLLGGEYSAS